MEIFKIENLTFSYPNSNKLSLDDINISIEKGEFVVLCGKSGCGKSTLIRHLKTTLTPYGKRLGNVLFNGESLSAVDLRNQSQKIGFVLQNPEHQIVTDKVWHELAFGLENLGYTTNEIRSKVSEMASFFGIQTWFHKNVFELSGGQKQLLNLASIMVMNPDVLILDEPTSQLDPIKTREFLDTIYKINRELGVTIILIEHYLEAVFPMCDRVILMEQGKIIVQGEVDFIAQHLRQINHSIFQSFPSPMRIYAGIKNDLKCPITVRDGRKWFEEISKVIYINENLINRKEKACSKQLALEIYNLWFRYEKDSQDILKDLNLKIYKGEFYAIVGGNGTGKTTTLSIISGFFKPYLGKIFINGTKLNINGEHKGTIGVLPQNPQVLFTQKTVWLDLYEIIKERNISKQEKNTLIDKIASICEITEFFHCYPLDLSGGEMQRIALAKLLLLNPKILLLDEPTKALDIQFKKKFGKIIQNLKNNGITIIMVSHDIEFCAEYADRCGMFFDGSIISEDEPTQFFSGKNFYTTSTNRMVREKLPNAILPEQVIAACGGDVFKDEVYESIDIFDDFQNIKFNKSEIFDSTEKKKKISKRTFWSVIMIILFIPFTIYIGSNFFGDKKYYFISLLIILETSLPFALIFEDRHPHARELIIISVLCAISVAGRVIFFILPHFKPVACIVIISGVCFGAETGFLVGAISAFASNIFFGQGPWTPYQMFSFGIIGFLAGILFKKGLLKKNRLSLCIYGGLATFFIYGGIMNFVAVLISQVKINLQTLVLYYISGIPVDLVHSFSTIIFLYFISKPMIEKLERIKIKHGFME